MLRWNASEEPELWWKRISSAKGSVVSAFPIASSRVLPWGISNNEVAGSCNWLGIEWLEQLDRILVTLSMFQIRSVRKSIWFHLKCGRTNFDWWNQSDVTFVYAIVSRDNWELAQTENTLDFDEQRTQSLYKWCHHEIVTAIEKSQQ